MGNDAPGSFLIASPMKNTKTGPKLPEQLLSGNACPRTISSLWEESSIDKTVDTERQLLSLVLPPWQRPPTWDEDRKRAFIEGVFLGFPPGAIVTVAPDWSNGPGGIALVRPRSGWLIDGQQRVTAIRDFLQGHLAIFDGVRYQDLSRPQQIRRFDQIILTRIELPNNTEEDLLKQLYRRMNYGGVQHTHDDLCRLESQ